MVKALRRARSASAAKPSKAKKTAPKAAAKRPRQAAKRAPVHDKPEGPSPNLLVTIDERHRARAGDEILAILGRAGLHGAVLTAAPGAGVVGVKIDAQDPRECIPKLRAVLMESPFDFQHTHRWMPVSAWTAPDAAELAKFAKRAGAEIGNESSWGIVVERHGSHVDRSMIVDTVAKSIDNPNVSLDAPEKTILIDVIGDRAALAVLGAKDQISVDRSLREDFVAFEEVVQFQKEG